MRDESSRVPGPGSAPDLDVGRRVFRLSERTHVMGILNATPDSFYDGSRCASAADAADRASAMEEEGADCIDVGAESTRPGAPFVSEEEEKRRLLPVIGAVRRRVSLPVSADTRRASVAAAALDAGADWINDVGGLTEDPGMMALVAGRRVAAVVMHKRGSPADMQRHTAYADLIGEIRAFFEAVLARADAAGVPRARLVLDPGIGFGKSPEDNVRLVRALPRFADLGCGLLVGPSRKSFIGSILGVPEADRLVGTAAAVTAAVLAGANWVRVHDVREMVQAVRVADRFRRAG